MCPETEESVGKPGTCESYLGVQYILDPEKFVDPGFQLSGITYDDSD